MLDRDSPVDLHEQLANELRSRIQRGELTGRVPSIKHTAQEFEVSTKTAERAYATLVDEDLIVARVGRGFFVKPK